jgi:hypothetical protein
MIRSTPLPNRAKLRVLCPASLASAADRPEHFMQNIEHFVQETPTRFHTAGAEPLREAPDREWWCPFPALGRAASAGRSAGAHHSAWMFRWRHGFVWPSILRSTSWMPPESFPMVAARTAGSMRNGWSHRRSSALSSALSQRSIPATPLDSPGCTSRQHPGGPDL